MASTGSVDGWPLGPTELGEAGLRVLLRLPTQASSSYTELKSSCARHDVRIRISSLYVARSYLEREYCIKSRRDKIGITRHIMMHQVLHIVQLPNEEVDMHII